MMDRQHPHCSNEFSINAYPYWIRDRIQIMVQGNRYRERDTTGIEFFADRTPWE